MRDALLRDLALLPYKIYTTVDARLVPPVQVHSLIVVNEGDDVWQIWGQAIQAADAVWLIAPETDGFLKKLTELAVKLDKPLFGCGLHSVEIASSKVTTYHVLQQAGIATIPTFSTQNWPENDGIWLTKPDDGAGCDETFVFENQEELVEWLATGNKALTHIVQPFQAGLAASISCVMYHGKAHVLSCNAQQITVDNKQLKFNGCIVNGMSEHWEAFEVIASRIAQALPDLAGYVGVDVIVDGERVIVVEINPRLTTSYSVLAEATGVNPAALIINLLIQGSFSWPKLKQKVIEVHV